MSSQQLYAQNIKCAGCVANIKNGLSELAGVEAVEVDIASGRVSIEGSAVDTATITAKLAALGYPVA